MSRVGKQPILIPEKVEVEIDGNLIMVKGPKGELKRTLPDKIKSKIEEGKILFFPVSQNDLVNKKTMALWGLSRALVANMVKGVKEGYEKKLEIQGIGFRVAAQADRLVMNLGFSHPVEFMTPKGIEFKIEKNIIIVGGVDKELVGQTAAAIRALKKAEPYKGKGIRYQGEVVKIKAGKKAISTET